MPVLAGKSLKSISGLKILLAGILTGVSKKYV